MTQTEQANQRLIELNQAYSLNTARKETLEKNLESYKSDLKVIGELEIDVNRGKQFFENAKNYLKEAEKSFNENYNGNKFFETNRKLVNNQIEIQNFINKIENETKEQLKSAKEECKKNIEECERQISECQTNIGNINTEMRHWMNVLHIL